MKMLLAAAAAIVLAGGSAEAAISVLGGGQAEDCFLAVKAGRFDTTSMDLCNLALETEVLSPQDRGGTLVNRGVMKLLRGDYVRAPTRRFQRRHRSDPGGR